MTESTASQWTERFRAVARAQTRYIYLLAIVGIFYWALDTRLASATAPDVNELQVPVVGIKIDASAVWSSAAAVLGLLVNTLLGTFSAIRVAYKGAGGSLLIREGFERLDTSPTAIDFFVYSRNPTGFASKAATLSYPLFISLFYFEGGWLWYRFYCSAYVVEARSVILVAGAVAMLACLPRLSALWVGKVRETLGRGKQE